MKNKLKISVALLTACALLFASVLPLTALAESEGYAPRDGEIWDGSIASSFAGGSGTQNDPYLISNGAELAFLAQQVTEHMSFEGVYFEMTDDICLNDVSGFENWSSENPPANEWLPIGGGRFPLSDGLNYGFYNFCGNFNGGGHTVYGLYYYKQQSDFLFDCVGLFGSVRGAAIGNLTLDKSYMEIGETSSATIGGICASANNSSFENCFNYATLIGTTYVGGICASAGETLFSRCTNYGEVAGFLLVGGIAGRTFGDVLDCANYGRVSLRGANDLTMNFGGIAGEYSGGSIERCANLGAVDGGNLCGGLVGSTDSETPMTLSKCYNAGSVNGSANIGGFLGWTGYASRALIENCYNAGSVSGEANVGGFIGYVSMSPEISCCYNAGTVEASENANPISGCIEGSAPEMQNCYYLDTCCEAAAEGASALTAEQLMTEESYVGFDFETVWTMAGNAEYPYAELIGNPHGGGEPLPALPGDADGNGTVNIADGIIALRFTLGLVDESAIVFENADINGDGSVSVADAILILRIALGL